MSEIMKILLYHTIGTLCAGLYSVHDWNTLLIVMAIFWWIASLYTLLDYTGIIKLVMGKKCQK